MRIVSFMGAAALAGMLLSPLPALAGAAESAFLAKLVGSWTGTGTITGAQTGPLDCTLTIKSTKKGVSFNGRCKAEEMGTQTFTGTIAYNDATKQYEAASNGQTNIGVKAGSGVTFTSRIRNMAGSGNSVMKVTTSKITIDATVARSEASDKKYTSHIVMTK